MRSGVIYSAVGEKYLAEAVISAQSSLRFNRVPHVIFCQEVPSYGGDIEFRRIQSTGDPFLDKINAICSSPFEWTLFLDTDTYVLADISELFDLLRRFDFAAAHAALYMNSGDPVPSKAFNDLNTGVIAFRQSPVSRQVLDKWSAYYKMLVAVVKMDVLDQYTFRRALWDSDASLCTLSAEYNYRTPFPGRLISRAKILQGRVLDYEEYAARLNSSERVRLVLGPNDSGINKS